MKRDVLAVLNRLGRISGYARCVANDLERERAKGRLRKLFTALAVSALLGHSRESL
jgi:hypothetical protein